MMMNWSDTDLLFHLDINLTRGNNNFQVKESCTRNLNPSFASHGVSTQSASTAMQREKTESLETPVIEMKEPSWQTTTINTSATATTNEEDNTIFSVWEENYQDLSDWCMDAFQGQCAFLTGESGATKHLGTKIEGKIVSKPAVEVGGIHLTDRVEEKRETMEEEDDRGVTINTQMIHKHKIPKEERVEELADVWLDQPKSAIALRTDEWIQLVDNERTDEPFQRDWDVVSSFDNTGLNSFDLLSYLCDDNIQSPDGSVSTDSASVQTNPNDRVTFSNSKSVSITKKPETVTSSSISNSGSSVHTKDEPKPSSSSRSTRVSREPVKKVKTEPASEPSYGRSSRGKKRSIESDSDDRMSDCSSYRESREKNNQASRKSRQNKKAKETEMMAKASKLEKDNRLLKIKVEELEKMVTSMRAAILRSAMKRAV